MTQCHKALSALMFGLAFALAACGGSDETPSEVVLVTHDSFAISDDVKRAFEDQSGLTLRILKAGDAGEIVTRALLTAGNPEGDVLFGVDNNLLQRALEGDVFEEYESPQLENVDPELVLDPHHRATPIDRGDVCLNYDKRWFTDRGVEPPSELGDLLRSSYRELMVVENPATSTPGLAFLLATIAAFGDSWQGFWRTLRENGVLVVDGWEDAYYAQFSGSAGSKGKRPIVVSYASSPPAEVIFRDPVRPRHRPASSRGHASARSSSLECFVGQRTKRARRSSSTSCSRGASRRTFRCRCSCSPPARTPSSRRSSSGTRSFPRAHSSFHRRRSRRTESAGWTSGRTS